MAVLLMSASSCALAGTEWFVDASVPASGDGSAGAPFKTITEGLSAAQTGDAITVRNGTYDEHLVFPRGGVTLRAAQSRGAIVTPGDKIRVEQDDITIEGLVFDWQFCGSDGLRIYNDRVTLRDCELRNTGGSGTPPGDALELNGCDQVLIESCYIHHCLNGSQTNQYDAHGITGYPTNTTIRNTTVAYITGDCIQFSPSRRPWGPVLVEGCDLLTGPLPAGLPPGTDWNVGEIPGENGLDTKQKQENPRSRIVLRDCLIHGFKDNPAMGGSNAAINAKDHVEVLVDRCTVYDNDWAFRLRGPGTYTSTGSYDTLTNCVMYDNVKAVRYENEIRNLHIYNCTFGGGNEAFFQSAGGHGSGFEVQNCLFYATSKPAEAADASNLATTAGFVNAAGHNYHLAADSPAIDRGMAIAAVTADRDGTQRPQGSAYDVGAYEWLGPNAQLSHELPAPGYYMISFPLIVSSPTPHDLLCDDLGDGSYYMWSWDAGGYESVPSSQPECQNTTLSMHEGYWVLADAGTLEVSGTTPVADQRIPLDAGWNMVGARYDAVMDGLLVDRSGDVKTLAQAQAAGWALGTFYYSHDGTGSYRTVAIDRTPQDTLSLWHGYWVLVMQECSLLITHPPPSPSQRSRTADAREVAPRPGWAFDIRATVAGFADSITIAAASSGSDGFDGFGLDRPKPPAPPGEHRLRTVLTPDAPFVGRGCPSPPAFASELAMETKGAVQEAAEWELTVSGGVDGEPVTLRWPELSRLPKDCVPILTDRDTGKRTFMRTRAQYEFSAPGEGSSRSRAERSSAASRSCRSEAVGEPRWLSACRQMPA